MKITTAQIQDRINDSACLNLNFELVEDLLFVLTTDPELMAELNHRAADWRREMELNHPDR